MVAGMNNLSTLLHPSALGNLVIFPLGLELAYHLTSFNYCLQSCSQFSTGQVPTAISRPSAIGLVKANKVCFNILSRIYIHLHILDNLIFKQMNEIFF